MKNLKFLLIFLLILLTCFFLTAAGKTNGQKSKIYLDFMLGCAIPINASYIDTFENQDIYWNPNCGANIDLRLRIMFNDIIGIALPLDFVIGIYQYKTHDGKKVGTEAGTNPITTNTEWSLCPNFTPTIILKPSKHPACPYFGVGVGIGFLWSWESWDFTNRLDMRAQLYMIKYYWPSVNVKAEIGWNIPLGKGFSFDISCVFNLANYIMYKVELTNYLLNNVDTIQYYDEKSRIYNYAFDAPDENKGGNCLLGGFVYENYPQQKIATNASVKIGFSYNF
jgi:hypothetical protein